MKNVTFTLERPAKKDGGDRYTGDIKGEDRPMVIYIPQTISRPDGDPAEKITLSFDVQADAKPKTKKAPTSTIKKKKKKRS